MLGQNELKELAAYSKTLKVLYVEDNSEARTQALKLFENFYSDITIALNGEDGLNKFLTSFNDINSTNYDLIFTDLNMPVMGGIEMIEKIRSFDIDIPIVVITAHTEKSLNYDASTHNIKSYLIKPVSLDKFIETMVNIKNR